MNMKNNRKGFTTVELVIVIAVIAILATVLIPTFSNLINQANLSTDKQNVRNMNMVLMTYMIEGTDDFGDVRNQLIDGGYQIGEKFAPKTEGYRYLWYAEKNVILLVDAENNVVYPEGEEYENLKNKLVDVKNTPDDASDDICVLDNIRMCFDLSLPAVIIEKVNNPKDDNDSPIYITDDESYYPDDGFDLRYESQPLSMMYTFTMSEDECAEYAEWIADFYVTIDLPKSTEDKLLADNDFVVLSVVGRYDWYTQQTGKEWVPITLPLTEDVKDLGLLWFKQGENYDYQFVYDYVKTFDCGIVADEIGGYDQGTVLTVELRLTEAYRDTNGDLQPLGENPRQAVLGIFTYTYK